MKISEAIEAIKEKLTAARAGRIATVGVISVYGPVVYAELDNNGPCPVRVCVQEGPYASDRFTINLAEIPDRAYLLADLYKAIVPQKPLKCRVKL